MDLLKSDSVNNTYLEYQYQNNTNNNQKKLQTSKFMILKENVRFIFFLIFF